MTVAVAVAVTPTAAAVVVLVPALVGGLPAACGPLGRFLARSLTAAAWVGTLFFDRVLARAAFHRALTRVPLALGAAGDVAAQGKVGEIQVSDALERHPEGVRSLLVSQELQVVPKMVFVFEMVRGFSMVLPAAAAAAVAAKGGEFVFFSRTVVAKKGRSQKKTGDTPRWGEASNENVGLLLFLSLPLALLLPLSRCFFIL